MEDIEGEKLRLVQRKEFLETRIVENKAWAANYGMRRTRWRSGVRCAIAARAC